jgi:predicted nucleic-acid-binding protein
MKAIDTNVLIRFIMKDDEKQAQSVYQLFKQSEQNQQPLFVPLLVVLEVIWVLQSVYEIPDADIVQTFSDLLAMPVLSFESENVLENFIESTANTSFDLSDLLIANSAYSSACESIFTFDKKASKFKYFELLK